MFGLMKSRVYHADDKQRKLHRLHYCGICKTMGRIYGQKTRFLLNHDIVFLGELLSSISGTNQSPAEWNNSYQAYNCFFLPKSKDEMPISLQFAAAVNLILSEVKVDDHITDSSFYLWKIVRKFLSNNFRKASDQMEQWKFPLHELWRWASIQKEREKNIEKVKRTLAVNEVIDFLAEPAAVVTGLTFRHGAKLANKESLQHAMYELGFSFGKLAYLLDAFEDYERDHQKQGFNAWQVVYDISDGLLSKAYRDRIIEFLMTLRANIDDAIYHLPISQRQSEYFVETLKLNLSRKLYVRLPMIQNSCETSSEMNMTLKERWQFAKQAGKFILQKSIQQNQNSIVAYLNSRTLYASYVTHAFLFPAYCSQTRLQASNYIQSGNDPRDCYINFCSHAMSCFGLQEPTCCNCICFCCILYAVGQVLTPCCCGNSGDEYYY